jgi:hypothetical protein
VRSLWVVFGCSVNGPINMGVYLNLSTRIFVGSYSF